MLTYIYCDGEQIERYGDAAPVRQNIVIYLDDNTPYLVNEVQVHESSGTEKHTYQCLYVSRCLSVPRPPL